MGSCLSRLKHLRDNENQNSSSHLFEQEYDDDNRSNSSESSIGYYQRDLDNYVIEAEKIFLTVINIIELPLELRKLIQISNTDDGWIKTIKSMINVVGTHAKNGLIENDYIGPTIIILLLEDSLLPTRFLIEDLLTMLEPYLNLRIHNPCDDNIIKHRNLCTILSFLAEKLAGSLSANLLSNKVLQFLERIIKENLNFLHILFALNCIEKFALTRENKEAILKHFDIVKELCELEKYVYEFNCKSLYYCSPKDLLKYQVGFCAQWCLDNVFLKKGRKLTYKCIDYNNFNVVLNVNDKTEFLKLSPDGLSVRCDTFTFESVRSNFAASSDVYFYEVILLTSGIMQIGWATKSAEFNNQEGIGVGDDLHSIAFDGCRKVIWHNENHYKYHMKRWDAGDVVGCLIDFPNKKFIFYHNGKKIEINKKISDKLCLYFSDEPYYPAASLMSYQQCCFNFGQTPFRYPPKKYKFKDFHSEAVILDKNEFKIVPMHIKLKKFKSFSLTSKRNLCNICFEQSANVRLKPCDHDDLCSNCASRMKECPFCRIKFTQVESLYK